MLNKQEKRERERVKKEKLSIRVIGKTPEKKKKWPTGELELFKKIAAEKWVRYLEAKHMDKLWIECTKLIHIDDLTPWNFDHTTPKSRGKDYRLDPENIQIVSVAWHFWKTNWQILKVDYPN